MHLAPVSPTRRGLLRGICILSDAAGHEHEQIIAATVAAAAEHARIARTHTRTSCIMRARALQTHVAARRDLLKKHGYAYLPQLLPMAMVEQLRERFAKLFRGEFETGVYPDE
jgi:hypothetical protein